MDEPGRHRRAGHVGDQLPAPLHRDVLEDHQVNGQRPQPRADRQRRVRHARRARRDMRLPAGALAPHAGRAGPAPQTASRDLFLLKGPGDAQVSGVRQVAAARAGALRVMILGPVRDLPASSTRPGCPAASPASFAARSAARRCCRGGRASPAGHPTLGGIEEFPLFRDAARARGLQLLPQVSDQRLSAAICSACCRISASRGSAGSSGASLTNSNHPAARTARRPGTPAAAEP